MRKFAISDIHGCPQTLQHLVENGISLKPSDQLFLLGDYVNRGPDSTGVMDLIMKWQEAGYQVACLRGNHEDRVERALNEGWYQMEEKYVNFIKGLHTYLEADHYILVHAGLNFQLADPMSDTWSMRWIRDWEENANRDWLNGRKVVYGHKRKSQEAIESFVVNQTPYLGIDNGCCMNDTVPGEGKLCALQLGSERLFFQENIDMPAGHGEADWKYLFEYVA